MMTDDYWSKDIVGRLMERAAFARQEDTGTALADAVHFEQAAKEIALLRSGIKRLSDEEELLAETTDGDEFTLVSIAAKLSSAEIANRRLIAALRKVEWWAQQKCPCHEETPNPCTLCGASVENLEACKAVESTFPRDLLEMVRSSIDFSDAGQGYRLVPEKMTAAMINAWSGGETVTSDAVAYNTHFQEAWARVLRAAKATA